MRPIRTSEALPQSVPEPDSELSGIVRDAHPYRGPSASPRELALSVENVTVSFDGFKALDDVTLEIQKGELRCIIGPNGAGKTTLMDVITGRTRPTAGFVYLGNRTLEISALPEWRIARLGIGRKFQRPTVFPGHTVLENFELAQSGNKGVFANLLRRRSASDRERIEHALESVGLTEVSDRRAGVLSHGHKQWLEIGMLLVQEPQVLLVDEPVAGLSQQEMEKTAELLSSLAGERTVVVVEHDMEFVRSIAEKVTVLHEGRVLAEGSLQRIQEDPRVIDVYLGV